MVALSPRALFLVLAGSVCAEGLASGRPHSAGRAQAPAAPLSSRRAVVSSALLTSLVLPLPAHASFAERADVSLERIRSAESPAQLSDGLKQLGQLAEEYGGLADRTDDTVQKLRTLKSSPMWSEEVEGAYRDAMRSIDPFRVVAVRPAMQASVYLYAPVYVALLGVQQVLPKFFGPAYAAAALVLLGPIAFAVSNS
jgi:hypothetical protein